MCTSSIKSIAGSFTTSSTSTRISSTPPLAGREALEAVLVRAPGLAAGLEMIKFGKAAAFAANKTILFELSGQLPGSRVLHGRFTEERVAMAIPKGHGAGVPYVRRFVEDAKSQGLA